MPNFPFQRAKSLGWSLFEVFTSAQANIIDANAAQAADGLVWTDVAQFRNWTPPVTVTEAGLNVAYTAVNDSWWVASLSGGILINSRMWGGGGEFIGGFAAPTGGIAGLAPRASAFDPVNNYLVYGITPSAPSNVKYRRALMTGNGAFSAATNSTQNNNSGPTCLAWAGAAGVNMLISGHSVTGVIETSADGGATWTNRAIPNVDGRLSIAAGPPGIVMSSDSAQSHLAQSTDGIIWTQRSLPSSKIWNVVWCAPFGKFFAIAEDVSAIASSADGITWASIGSITLPVSIGTISTGFDSFFTVMGRTIFGVVHAATTLLIYSQDAGVTWKIASSLTGGGFLGQLGNSGRQLMYTRGTSVQWSIAGGF